MEHSPFESAMAGSRMLLKNNNYFNHKSMNGLFLIVYNIMALMFPSQSTTFDTKVEKIICISLDTCYSCTIEPMCVWSIKQQECQNKNQFNSSSLIASRIGECPQFSDVLFPLNNTLEKKSNEITCSDSMTCTKCTIKPDCVWSLEQQKCVNKNQLNSSSLNVFVIEECPKYSIVTTYRYVETHILVDNILKITNDLLGFIQYLLSSKIYFGLRNEFERSAYKINKTIISFQFRMSKSILFDYEMPTVTYFMYIRFNSDIILRFDDVTDHYITFYKHEKCATHEEYKSCVTCGWNKNGYSNYLKWCSSEDTCEISKNVCIKDNHRHELNENVAYVTNDCAEINVTAVDPLSGPETGGTTVTITVRNHWILADNRTVTVTMAGTVCSSPRSSGLETITCTTSRSIGTLFGPVLVEYSSIDSLLKIESSQIFHFCFDPVLDADQQLGGVESGGTSVPVRGSNFVENCVVSSARLYVDLPDGVRRYADCFCDPPVNDTYMVCRSPKTNGAGSDGDKSVAGKRLNFGLMVMKFTGNQLLHVDGTSLGFYVRPDPVLVDFVTDDAGSIVIINGLNLQNIQLDDITVRSVYTQSKCCVVVSVTRHSLVCEPTMPVKASKVISVRLGNSLVFTVTRRTSTHPGDTYEVFPRWILVTMGLVFGCVFAYSLIRTKHRYNPVIVTRSLDL